MKFIVFAIAFIVSIGLSTLGMMSAYRLKKQDLPYASSLFYLDTFLIAFGFYGIWGFLFFNFLFDNVELAAYLLPNLLGIFPILGIPLLIVAWYLLIQFCLELTRLEMPALLTVGYFILFIACFFLLGLHFKTQISNQSAIDLFLMFKLIAIIHLFFLFAGGFILLIGRGKTTTKQSLFIIWDSLLIPIVFASASLFIVSSHWVMVPVLVIFYFCSIAILPALLFFNSNDQRAVVVDFEGFCKQYEISKRESEIIHEICQGKTNKEIATALFITLQTVKDHTHRIYTKTNVSNRVQLTNLVNESIKS